MTAGLYDYVELAGRPWREAIRPGRSPASLADSSLRVLMFSLE